MSEQTNTVRILLFEDPSQASSDSTDPAEAPFPGLTQQDERAGHSPSLLFHTAAALLRFTERADFPEDASVVELTTRGGLGLELVDTIAGIADWERVDDPHPAVASSPSPIPCGALRVGTLPAEDSLQARVLDAVIEAVGTVEGTPAPGSDQTDANALERATFQASPSPLLWLFDDGETAEANPALRMWLGHTSAPREDLPLDRILNKPAIELIRKAHRHAIQLEGVDAFADHQDGSRIPAKIALFPTSRDGGTPSVCTVAGRHLPKTPYPLGLDALPCGIVLVDEEGRITRVNAETERLFQYTRSELLGRPVECLLPEAMRGPHQALRAAFVADASRRAMGAGRDLHGRRRDGTQFPIEIGLNPMATSEGVRVLSTIVDITKRRQLELEGERQRAELIRSNEDLQEFAYAASHDLQEPLRMVSAFTSLLAEHLEGQLDEEAERYIHFVRDGADRMRALIDGLLSLSRIRTQGGQRVPLRLVDVVEEARLDLSPRIQTSEAELEVDIPDTLWVRGDANQLRSLFVNLLGNALKYRRQAPPSIRVSCLVEGPEATVSIADDGIGIPPDKLERVFVLFERLHAREEYPGTGIGLALCKRVVERHGGRIEADSDGTSGSTFRVTLPTAVPRE